MKSKDLLEFIRTADYKILDVINLLEYDNDLSALHLRFRGLKKEYFSPNERIVILHLDNEYFYHDCPTGLTTHNLFVIMKSLDFPLHVLTFITSYPDYQRAIKPFVSSEHDVPEIFNPLLHFISLQALHKLQVFSTDIHKDIKHHAMCLLGTARSHRVKLCQFMQYHNLDSKINYTLLNSSNLLSVTDIKSLIGDRAAPVYDLIYSHPHRINDGWANYIDNHQEINCLNSVQVGPTTNPHLSGQGVDFYNTHAIDIVTESALDYPYVYLSEKTFRPILMETPFIAVCPQGTLRHLRSFGIKTFGDYWDESYDDISDPRDRFLAVTKVIQQVCNRPLSEIKRIYQNMRPRLYHNRTLLLEYIKTVTQPLYNKLKAFESVSVADIKNL